MSSGGAVTFSYDFPAGNTILMSVTLTDFSGNTVYTNQVSSISLSVFPPFVTPWSQAALATIIPSVATSTSWTAYYTPVLSSALGIYTVGIQASTISGFQVTDYSKFRLIEVDA